MAFIAFSLLAIVALTVVRLVRDWYRSCEKRYAELLGDPRPQ
jgi:hypothetical protein